MAVTNLPPSTVPKDTVKTFAFPYQVGSTKFPKMAAPNRPVFDSIQALLSTGKNERVMRPDFGVSIYEFIFDNMSPITQARVATSVTQAIAEYEPRAEVISVEPSIENSDGDNEGNVLVLNLVYQVAGQVSEQQVILPLTDRG